jgi:Uncharacterized protein conserved in bacteria (DUF2252)
VKLLACVVLAACGSHPKAEPDATTPDSTIGLPAPVEPSDFANALDKAYIRNLQTWISDADFEVKWTAMLGSPIEFLGAANSAYHADLAARADALPGGEVQCHGDAKLDNFGWMLVAGAPVFSDSDFDDAGLCPAAADILHFLLATDIAFHDADLDAAALDAYIASLSEPPVAVDPTTQPDFAELHSDGLDKDTSHDKLSTSGDVQKASNDEVAAITALVASDARFPTVLDIARDLNTTGGSAALRRFWLLVEDAQHPRTIIELKELATPGTEFGPHSTTFDGDNRFDVLKPFWWNAADLGDHFMVDLLNSRFIARDRFTRANADPTMLSNGQLQNALQAEASLMAVRHSAAWQGISPTDLRAWLSASTATITTRWLAAFTVDGGT